MAALDKDSSEGENEEPRIVFSPPRKPQPKDKRSKYKYNIFCRIFFWWASFLSSPLEQKIKCLNLRLSQYKNHHDEYHILLQLAGWSALVWLSTRPGAPWPLRTSSGSRLWKAPKEIHQVRSYLVMHFVDVQMCLELVALKGWPSVRKTFIVTDFGNRCQTYVLQYLYLNFYAAKCHPDTVLKGMGGRRRMTHRHGDTTEYRSPHAVHALRVIRMHGEWD